VTNPHRELDDVEHAQTIVRYANTPALAAAPFTRKSGSQSFEQFSG